MATVDKKLFLVASTSDSRSEWMEKILSKLFPKSMVFRAKDGREALDKLQNFPPHILITDLDLPKISGPKLVDHACSIKAAANTAVVIAGALAPESSHMDEVVSGKLHFFTTDGNEQEFKEVIGKALTFSSKPVTNDEFRIRNIKQGEVLLREGDKADFVYFVKKGRLVATREDGKVVLGHVEFGEFVGEMAFINGEARNATVTAITDCELIQVPINRFDKVLYSQPTWSKALMMTLTKRVSAANAKTSDKA